MQEETFAGRGGARIFIRSSRPIAPRAVVVISHGVNSHGGQYLWDGRAARGGGLLGVRHRPPRPRQVGRPALLHQRRRRYTDDVGTSSTGEVPRAGPEGVPVRPQRRRRDRRCTWALDHQAEIAGFICESFAFQVSAPALGALRRAVVGQIAPKLPVLKLNNKDFTRDPAALQALDDDPLTKERCSPRGTVAALLKATDRMTREFRPSRCRCSSCTARTTRRRCRPAASSSTTRPARATRH